jgi:hypothetical protein
MTVWKDVRKKRKKTFFFGKFQLHGSGGCGSDSVSLCLVPLERGYAAASNGVKTINFGCILAEI